VRTRLTCLSRRRSFVARAVLGIRRVESKQRDAAFMDWSTEVISAARGTARIYQGCQPATKPITAQDSAPAVAYIV